METTELLLVGAQIFGPPAAIFAIAKFLLNGVREDITEMKDLMKAVAENVQDNSTRLTRLETRDEMRLVNREREIV